MWKQKSRVTWLKKGDNNSRYFHTKTSNRRRCNLLTALKIEMGVWVEGHQIESHVVNYFQPLFSANPDLGTLDFLPTMERRVTLEMNADLIYNYSMDELCLALKQMHPSKTS